MKKKGFTLLELLAVIIILAVIAIIATPIVLNVVDEAKKSSFQDSAYGLIKSGEYYYTSQMLSGGMNEDKTFNFPGDSELEFSGVKPKSGYITVTKDGKVEIAVSDGKYCATKGFDETKVTVKVDDGKCGDPITFVSWSNGNTENFKFFDSLGNQIAKVSDIVLNTEDLNHAVYTYTDNSSGNVNGGIITDDMITFQDEQIIVYNSFVLVVLEDNVTYSDMIFPEAGIYSILSFFGTPIDLTFTFDWSGEKIVEIPENFVVENITDESITLTEIEGYEYSKDGINWQDSSTFTDFELGKRYILYTRYKEETKTSVIVGIDVFFGFELNSENLSLIGYVEGETTELVIPDTVIDENGNERRIVSIGIETFEYNDTLISITLPEGLRIIGSRAFYSCDNLTTIVLPNSLTAIEYEAFAYSSSLKNITIPGNVATIGREAFSECDGLTSVTIEEGVKTIGNYAFFSCTNLVNVNMPNSVETIGEFAFAVCPKLTNIVLPTSLNTLGEHAFESTNLTSIVIPGSVEKMGAGVFYNCVNLTSVTIEEGVKEIGESTFVDCTNLSSIIIPEGVKEIGERAFSGCESLTSITMPNSVEVITGNMFYGNDALKEIIVNENNTRYISVDGVLYNKNKTMIVRYPIGKQYETYVIPSTVTTIGNYAFYDCATLTSVTIPSNVTVIGEYAFAGCDNLANINIPNSVTKIGSSAFLHCKSLTNITIPNGIESIEEYTFYYCTSLENIIIPDSVKTIGGNAFVGCESLSSIDLPSNLISIGIQAFGGCDALINVILPNSVTTMGNHAFSGCMNLETITLSTSLTTISELAFWECEKLKNVIMPNSIKTIERVAFRDCFELETINFSGTMAEWNQISLASDWKWNAPTIKVICSDGEISI